ncbi:hypothetical protein [Serratia quinivorans]|uniref:MrpH family fimbial adhesin n=1 Tax=Serratia quinivorans TaxID=137545 RepID=UPI0021794439|nr:hypothetical protein [Serratia quinivorans]CAI1958701.1 Uncharacterised protein [Serratia quinivorans]CAI2160717.1 Uncharacterised protein [Serratia quinivorans]
MHRNLYIQTYHPYLLCLLLIIQFPAAAWYTMVNAGTSNARVTSVTVIPGEKTTMCRLAGTGGIVTRKNMVGFDLITTNWSLSSYTPTHVPRLPVEGHDGYFNAENCFKLDIVGINNAIQNNLSTPPTPGYYPVDRHWLRIILFDDVYTAWEIQMNGRPDSTGPGPQTKCSATKTGDINFGHLTDRNVNGAKASTTINLSCDTDSSVKVTFVNLTTATGEISLRSDITGTLKVGGWPGAGGFTYTVKKGIPVSSAMNVSLESTGNVAPGEFRGVAIVRVEVQ